MRQDTYSAFRLTVSYELIVVVNKAKRRYQHMVSTDMVVRYVTCTETLISFRLS